MNEVLHANIFFAIASVATVIFLLLVAVALYQVIKILQAVRLIVERVAEGSDMIKEDVAAVRQFVKSGGLFSYIINQVRPTKRRRRAESPEDVDLSAD